MNIDDNRKTQLIATLAFVTVFLGLGCNSISPKLQDEYVRSGLNQGMADVIDKVRQSIPEAMLEDEAPGMSIALIDRDGILWAAGFGYTDYRRKTPVTTDTLFAICSISKTITATAVMVAVQDGLLELDVPVVEYVPQFSVNSRFEEAPHKKITLRHLLNHTSGMALMPPVGNLRDPSYGSLEETALSVSDTWLRHRVGERHSYSNLGYELIAYIIQVRSGKPFAKYVEDKVFTPLHMSNCTVEPEVIRNHPNRAIGHIPGVVKRIPIAPDVPWVGSGGVYASVKGMAKYVQFFLNQGKVDGQSVLDGRLIASMATPSIRDKEYGLGVEIHHSKYYKLHHGGGGAGFQSRMIWIPEYGIGSVSLVNAEGAEYGYDKSPPLLSDLIDNHLVQKTKSLEIPSVEYRAYLPPEPDTFTRFNPAWEKYIGTYRYTLSGWKLSVIARIGLGLGVTTDFTHVKVFEEDGYLYVDTHSFDGDEDGGRLNEHLPGLFFTATGKCLDLRGPELTWRNWKIEKVDDDADRNFDLNL